MKSITVPLAPMLGRVAVAPGARRRSAACGRASSAATWTPPTCARARPSTCRSSIPGALFYFGDGHALQGDGEVCGSGLETSMEVAFRFGLRKKQAIAWPRLEDADHLMVAGSARPLTDALRIAFVELIDWLVADYGFDKADAYQLRLAGRRRPRRQRGRSALHGGRQVPEALPAAEPEGAAASPPRP